MVKRAERAAVVAFLVLLAVSGTGVYENEPSETELVRTVAVDKTDDKICLTVSLGTGAENNSVSLRSSEGTSLSDAVDALTSAVTERRADFSHTEHILIGESAAREGILPAVFDYVSRSGDMRTDMTVFIVRKKSAGDFLAEVMEDGKSAAERFTNLARSADLATNGHAYTCMDATANLLRHGCALVLALEESEGDVIPQGFALVKDGFLVGFTDELSTKGICIAENTAKFESVTMDSVTLGIVSVKTRVRPVYENNTFTGVRIQITTEANVEQLGRDIAISEKNTRRTLEKKLAELQKARVLAAITLSRSMGCDYLRLLERACLGRLRAICADKPSFGEMTVSVVSDARILRSYDAVEFMGE